MELVRLPPQEAEIPAPDLLTPAPDLLTGDLLTELLRIDLLTDDLLTNDLVTDYLLAAARTRSRRLYVALAAVLSFNLAMVSGALTFWALALH